MPNKQLLKGENLFFLFDNKLNNKLIFRFLTAGRPKKNTLGFRKPSTHTMTHPPTRILLELQQACATGWLMLCGLNWSSGAMETASQIFTVSPVDTRRVTSSMTTPGGTYTHMVRIKINKQLITSSILIVDPFLINHQRKMPNIC